MRTSNERGIALIMTLLVTMLMTALLVGFTAVIMSDQRIRGIDRDRTQSFYAAHSGLEKMTVDLFNLFKVSVAPTAAQLTTVQATPPVIPGVTYLAANGTSGYTLSAQAPFSGVITSPSSPFSGLFALKTIYDMDSTARSGTGGEVHLIRRLETVAIPVFQFGMFSDVDLSFSAADDFDFGGRVHTNGNLFLAQGSGSDLTLRDKVTAVKEIVRQKLSNGNSIDNTGSTGTVSMAKTPNPLTSAGFRNLARTEGSVTLGPGPSPAVELNDDWPGLSQTTYNSTIRNGLTGARALNLPLLTTGGSNVDLVRRPVILDREDTTNPALLGQRFYSRVSLRILLSDLATDITTLPGIDLSKPPVLLDRDALNRDWIAGPPTNGTGYGPVDATHPPIALSPGPQPGVTANGSTNPGATVEVDVSGMLPFFQPVPLTVAGVAVTCSGRTPSTFTGCVNTPVGAVIGALVTGTLNSVPLTTMLTVKTTTANKATLSVTANTASAFAPMSFWSLNDLVTCTGNLPDSFTGCSVLAKIDSNTPLTTRAVSPQGTGLIGGYIKIEMQNNAGVWRDVTMEILNYGISAPNQGGATCGETNAIVRLQRLRDHNNLTAGSCNYAGSMKSWDYWPNALFDAREALQRDDDPGTGDDVFLGGVMYYVGIDVQNLSLWFQGTAPYAAGSGIGANDDQGAGYSVYFSDRRNNRDSLSTETGEYGWEDYVNPASSTGAPNGTLQTGEDLNGNGTLEVYGGVPNYKGVYNTVASTAPLVNTARPTSRIAPAIAQVNRPIIFRRALKLTDADDIVTTGIQGLTIASENPVYVQGNWNATSGNWTAAHAATSIIADAVTMLSNAWNDNTSFSAPYKVSDRKRSADTWYRVAIIAGKGPIFPLPSGETGTFGTDGGAHSFLRFLEGDSANGANRVNYRGSMVTFFYNRQAVGPFKCCGAHVYSVPARVYSFDTDFLNPALLPPLTPVFRDLNTLGFSEETRSGR